MEALQNILFQVSLYVAGQCNNTVICMQINKKAIGIYPDYYFGSYSVTKKDFPLSTQRGELVNIH